MLISVLYIYTLYRNQHELFSYVAVFPHPWSPGLYISVFFVYEPDSTMSLHTLSTSKKLFSVQKVLCIHIEPDTVKILLRCIHINSKRSEAKYKQGKVCIEPDVLLVKSHGRPRWDHTLERPSTMSTFNQRGKKL